MNEQEEGSYPVGTKVRVTKDHSVGWAQPWPCKDDVVTVVEYHPMPHTYGPKVGIYRTQGEDGLTVVVRADYVEEFVEEIPEGTLVFVTETHTTKEGRYLKVYAGDHLTVVEFSKGSDYVADHYWGVDAAGDYRALLPDKIALVEFKKLTPPVGPFLAATQGAVVWHERGTELEGYWMYSEYWGWSNFVATNPQHYREPEAGEDMRINGALARELA